MTTILMLCWSPVDSPQQVDWWRVWAESKQFLANRFWTPYIKDILPRSLETFVSNVTVANSRTTKVTHRGTSHILLHNYQDPGNSCILPLFGVLVVPKLASRLLSTDQLTYHQHTVTFNQSSIDFGIIDNLHGGVQEFLIYRLPRQFVLSENGQSLE